VVVIPKSNAVLGCGANPASLAGDQRRLAGKFQTSLHESILWHAVVAVYSSRFSDRQKRSETG
jgi:hypothetical protein